MAILVRRESSTGANDLHTIYRPCTVDEVLGNQTNMNMLRKGLDNNDLSHTFLFTGDPGCGKTTAARIISLGLNCEDHDSATYKPCLECLSCTSILNHNSMDVLEVNVGQTGGKDAVDNIARDLPVAPFSARFKVVIFDEAHKLTPAAQDLLLKIIEDGYGHVYFIFCTNRPEKLSDAFIGRCNVMHFGRISKDLIANLLTNVAEFEGMPYTHEIIDHIAGEARGVPRAALVLLRKIADEGSWALDVVKELSGIALDAEDPKIIEISRALTKGRFTEAFKIYDKVKGKTQAESVRIGIRSYLTGCLKRSRSYKDGDKFSDALAKTAAPIYEKGRPGDYTLYNYLYIVSKILR